MYQREPREPFFQPAQEATEFFLSTTHLTATEFDRVDSHYSGFIEAHYPLIESMLKDIPVLSLENALGSFDSTRVDLLAKGIHSVVYRTQEIMPGKDTTLKILIDFWSELDYFWSDDDAWAQSIPRIDQTEYDEAHPALALEMAGLICARNPEGTGRELALRQIFGHILGSLYAPTFIDPPVCIWTTSSEDGSHVPVGYSLPFIAGEAIRIDDDGQLAATADELTKKGIYTGNRDHSLNAVVNPELEVKKFIDVEIRT